jgi:hypothetical protein
MVLRTVGPRAGKSTFQHTQLTDLLQVELLPSMRRAAVTVAADLKAEQILSSTSHAVVVRLDDAGPPDFVDEFEESLVLDRADEIVIHWVTVSTRQENRRLRPGNSAARQRRGYTDRTAAHRREQQDKTENRNK